MSEIRDSSLSGRDLDRAVCLALGLKHVAKPWSNTLVWEDAAGELVYCQTPAFSALDGPLSPLLAWLRSKYLIVHLSSEAKTPLWRCVAELDIGGVKAVEYGATINEACCRCVLAVADIIEEPSPPQP